MRVYLKTIPFDLEKAKRIMEGGMKGMITDSQGRKVRIVATDVVGTQPILALTTLENGTETAQLFNKDGTYLHEGGKHECNLHIVVKTRYKDYSNFTPSLFQSCLAREGQSDIWKVCVFLGKTTDGYMDFLMSDNEEHEFPEYLPLSKDTYGLIDSTSSYNDYINELI